MIFVSRIRFFLAGVAAVSLAACATSAPPRYGATEYLGGIHHAHQGYISTPPGGMRDSISYWDGDGVQGSPSIRIDLNEQIAYFYKGGQLVGKAAVSTGREGYRTPPGNYTILEKTVDKYSNLYGEILDANGNVVKTPADVRRDTVPPGGRFKYSPMPYWMRLTNSGVGMHAGHLPGFPASHGCIRLPDDMAVKFFNNVQVGTPVQITGQL